MLHPNQSIFDIKVKYRLNHIISIFESMSFAGKEATESQETTK